MQTDSPPLPPKPRLRWYQYRLRTLLIFMTLLAVWMAWISHRARQQKIAVEKIQALGGTVYYDYQVRKGPESLHSEALPLCPMWLRKFIGDDYFQNVVWIHLDETKISDNDLEFLENLPALKILTLDETKITSNGLIHLEELKNLEYLHLESPMIDDTGLVHLKNLTTLRELQLRGKKITDESLKYFKNFNQLECLIFTDTRVTKKGAASLKGDLPKTKIILVEE